MPETDEKVTDTPSPVAFVAALPDGPRKRDAEMLLPWFGRVTGLEPRLWGEATIGYGRYHYRYASGREGDWLMTGYSPRRQATTIHVLPGYRFDTMGERLGRLGKHRLGKSCLYVTRLDDIDLDVLAEIVTEGLAHLRATYESAER